MTLRVVTGTGRELGAKSQMRVSTLPLGAQRLSLSVLNYLLLCLAANPALRGAQHNKRQGRICLSVKYLMEFWKKKYIKHLQTLNFAQYLIFFIIIFIFFLWLAHFFKITGPN